MKLEHKVNIPAPVGEVWKFFDDIHAVAACMPGAELTETVDDSTFNGSVKIVIGPLSVNYTGQIKIVERDDDNHRLALTASGRDRRGSGTARADVSVELAVDGESTTMRVVSDVHLTGRIASLGRGVQDVSNKLFTEFAEQVAARLADAEEQRGTYPAAGTGVQPEAPAPISHSQRSSSSAQDMKDTSSIKLGSLVLSVIRARLADLLQRLSERIRP